MSVVTDTIHDGRAPGTILYLDGVSVSFDGFKALNDLSLYLDKGEMRAIIGPNGAGKTTMMDVITGKTRPDKGTVLFREDVDLTRLDEADDRAARHRPQVPEADRVREPHRVDQPGAGAEGRARLFRSLFFGLSRRAARPDRRGPGHHPPQRRRAPARRRAQPRPEAVAGDRHAAGPGPGAAAGRRAGGRHDRRRDRGHGRAPARDRAAATRWSWSSTTWSSCAASASKVTVLHEGSVLAEGSLEQVQNDQRVIEVYLGR